MLNFIPRRELYSVPGRQLNQHPHIHVCVTRGGLAVKQGIWRSLFFKKRAVEAIWRIAHIQQADGVIIPKQLFHTGRAKKCHRLVVPFT